MFALPHGSELDPLVNAQIEALVIQLQAFLGVSLDETGNLRSQITTTTGGGGVPVGAITPYAAATAPAGWLLCNGDAVSRATYGDLFAVVGVTWGAGDGSTTFNLPDFRNRIPMGAGANVALAAATGSWNHTHVAAAHNHGIDLDAGLLTGAPSATTEVQAGTGATVASATHTHTTASHAHNAFTVNGGAASTSAANPPVTGVTFIIKTGL